MSGYNEQAAVFEFEKDLCRRILPVLRDFGAQLDDSWFYRQGNDPELPHWWRFRESHDSRKRTELCFRSISYEGGHRVYGEPQVSEEPSAAGGERERIVAPPEGLTRKVSREVKVREESSTDYRGAVSFSITHRDTVKASAKVGVDAAEVQASAESTTETSLKTDFGWANGQKSAHEVTVRGETTLNIPGGETRILTIDVSHVHEVRPFADVAYLDCELNIDLYDWSGNYRQYVARRGRHDNIIHCANIQDLLWLLEGKRPVEYPGMANFLAECSPESRDFHEWLKDRENRRVEIDGQRVRDYPSALDIEVRPE